MNKLINIILVLIFSTVFFYGEKIIISSFNGLVQVKKDTALNWQNVSKGQQLDIDTYIYTGFNSYALLQTHNAKIEVKPLSQVKVASLIAVKENVATDLYLKYGKVKANVETSKDVKTIFQVRSANSTASVRGTIFTFGEDMLYVEEGTVLLKSKHGDFALVQKNEKAYSPFMGMIENPYSYLFDQYYVNVNPIGLTDAEAGLSGDVIDNFGGGRRRFFQSKIIIIIEVID